MGITIRLIGGGNWQSIVGIKRANSKPGSQETLTFPSPLIRIIPTSFMSEAPPGRSIGSTHPLNAGDFTGSSGAATQARAAGPVWCRLPWTALTHNQTDSGSAPHADSRDMTFDFSGNLIEVDDGGIVHRSMPRTSGTAATEDWFSAVRDEATPSALSAVSPCHTRAHEKKSENTMGGIEFEDENGKVRSVCLEGGVIPFGDDSDVEAFERWKKTEEGREYFGLSSEDDDSEHYLSDKYPFDPETGMRGDEDDYIDYIDYEKCRAGCYRQFLYSGKHDCCICGVISCKQCARESGMNCVGDGCSAWICGKHAQNTNKCRECKRKQRDEENKGDKDKQGEDRKPAAKKVKK